ncbi:MAG: hypothetical protein LBB83_00765 [Treponema sp.]|nr:hypothetical protein [Treponema sp.]
MKVYLLQLAGKIRPQFRFRDKKFPGRRSGFCMWPWASLALILISACACSAETAVQQLLGLSAEAPEFLECRAISSTEISFRFSLPVTVTSLRFEPELAVDAMEDGEDVRVTLREPLSGGERFIADILVADEGGNTLNVLTPFRSRNDEMPRLVINEIRTEYSKPRVEFVELRTLTAGNLGGIRLFLAETGTEESFYEFLPARAAAGEYIVVHLRSLDPNSVNETGGDLGATPYTKENEAWPDSRDFWIPDAKKHLSKKAGMAYLLDQDDEVLDAILWSESADPWWTDERLAGAAEFLLSKGAWVNSRGDISGPGDAVSSAYTTATRSISRDQDAPDTNGPADWYITAASSATPGKKNSTKKYQP